VALFTLYLLFLGAYQMVPGEEVMLAALPPPAGLVLFFLNDEHHAMTSD
jgi:hypothetical protein